MYFFRFTIIVAMLAGAGLAATPAAGAASPGAAAASGPRWTSSVPFTNQVASSPTAGGGYPVPPGQTFPNPGTCGPGSLDSNHSESWIAVQPGTENLVGSSTHYPSDVTADGGGPVYYQQQVLATVPRSDFGTGF